MHIAAVQRKLVSTYLSIALLDNSSKGTEILVNIGRSSSANIKNFDFILNLQNMLASIEYDCEAMTDS